MKDDEGIEELAADTAAGFEMAFVASGESLTHFGEPSALVGEEKVFAVDFWEPVSAFADDLIDGKARFEFFRGFQTVLFGGVGRQTPCLGQGYSCFEVSGQLEVPVGQGF